MKTKEEIEQILEDRPDMCIIVRDGDVITRVTDQFTGLMHVLSNGEYVSWKIGPTDNNFGVPCSGLGAVANSTIHCTSESEAMAISAGVIATGNSPTVYLQNSGLGNIVDVVTSLYHPYKIPLPKITISIRHSPHHHSFMYELTKPLLEMLGFDNYAEIQQS